MLGYVCGHEHRYPHRHPYYRPQRPAARVPPAGRPARKQVIRNVSYTQDEHAPHSHARHKTRAARGVARGTAGAVMPGSMRARASTPRGAHFEGQRRTEKHVEEGADTDGERVLAALLGEAGHAQALVDAPEEVQLQQREDRARLLVFSHGPAAGQRRRQRRADGARGCVCACMQASTRAACVHTCCALSACMHVRVWPPAIPPRRSAAHGGGECERGPSAREQRSGEHGMRRQRGRRRRGRH